jgi:D-alanyl-D-alanine carboxypeptidase
MKKSKKIFGVGLVAVTALAVAGWLMWHPATPTAQTTTIKTVTKTNPPAAAAAAATSSGFDKSQYSLTDPTSIWVVVNKQRALNPINYAPKNLTVPSLPLRVPGNESMQIAQQTATAMQKMFAGAKTEGLNLMISSGYRSFAYQTGLYGGYVKTEGQAKADTQSARPGHSEHQTGFAADLEGTNRTCELEICFGDTPEGKWIAAHGYEYGFIIRYPADKVPVTGYQYEPWHVRFVGVELATEMHNQGVKTLEEFFGLGAAPDYQ